MNFAADYRITATHHRAKVRFVSKCTGKYCFVLWNYEHTFEHEVVNQKELNSNIERWVCVKEITGLSGA